ncbi:hypothetical protein EYR40_010765 [Pleurotus pulmonarius]|nr:hypothetical protein EYR40_010765 [Pleurotus pulmonarius]
MAAKENQAPPVQEQPKARGRKRKGIAIESATADTHEPAITNPQSDQSRNTRPRPRPLTRINNTGMDPASTDVQPASPHIPVTNTRVNVSSGANLPPRSRPRGLAGDPAQQPLPNMSPILLRVSAPNGVNLPADPIRNVHVSGHGHPHADTDTNQVYGMPAQQDPFPDPFGPPTISSQYPNTFNMPQTQYPVTNSNAAAFQGFYMPPLPMPPSNADWPQSSPLHPGTPRPTSASTSPVSEPEFWTAEKCRELEAKCKKILAEDRELRDKLAAAEAMKPSPLPVAPGSITAIQKPKGEAGDTKRGFNLCSAMGLDEDRFLYTDIMRAVRRNAARAGIDYRRLYREQDHDILGKIFKAGRQLFPYLTKDRFPHDWAQAEILKQFLKNSRRSGAKRERKRNDDASLDPHTLKERKSFTYGNSSDTAGSSPTAGPSRPVKRSRIHTPRDDSDIEDDVGHQHGPTSNNDDHDDDNDDLYN